MFRSILLSVALLVAAPVLTASAQERGELLDRVVAIVNDGIVTESELDEQLQTIQANLRESNTTAPPMDVLRRQVLDRLVLQEIQLQLAGRMGLAIDEERLGEALTEIAQRAGMTLRDLPAALAADGINYAQFRDSIRKDMTLRALRQREVLSRINVTPRELEQFMERLKRLPDENAEYNISHILLVVPSDATEAQADELAELASSISARAATEDFSQLAVTYSNSTTALEGGALGWRRGSELPSALTDTIVALRPGETSKPVAVPGGFHIVKLNEMRSAQGNPIEAQTLSRHILLTPNELEDDATIRQKLAGIRQRILDGEDFAAFASSMSEDSGSAVNGGDLDWNGPGTFVPEFEQTLARLEVNEISEPFRSQFGWHIVQLLGRRDFDTTEDSLRQRAFVQLRESKAEEEVELWLRRLRDEAFVETII